MEGGLRVECDFRHDPSRSDMWGTRYRGVLVVCNLQYGKAWVELDTYRAIFEVDLKGVMPESNECVAKRPERWQHVEVLSHRGTEWWEAHVVARNVMGEESAVEVEWHGKQWRGSQNAVVDMSQVRAFVSLPNDQTLRKGSV